MLKIYSAPTIDLPDNIYQAKVIDIVEVDNQFYKIGDPEHKEKSFEWSFQITYKDDDGEKRIVTLSRRTGRTTSPKGNFYKFVKGITGSAPTVDLDPTSFIGKECRVVIKNVEKDGQSYPNIVETMATGKTAEKSTEEPAEDESEDTAENENWLDPSA